MSKLEIHIQSKEILLENIQKKSCKYMKLNEQKRFYKINLI